MPSTTGYNGSTDFLKWYKQNYGADYDEKTGLSRKAGMTDGDWDVGTILHNYYIKNQQNEAARQENIGAINERYNGMIDTAKAGFDSARKTLGENKTVAQQNASITYDKLKKYLPMKQQAQGLGGLGTQSAELDAYNRYMSQMGGITSDYQGNMRAIEDSETKTVGELERYRSDSLEENDNLYDSLARTYGDNADAEAKSAWKGYLEGEKNKRDEAYNMAQGILSNSTSDNLADLMNYVNSLNGKVSAEQLAALGEYAKSIADRNAQAATDKQQSGYGDAFNMAVGVLQSATTDNPEELLAYVNSLEGKVSPEQLAALRQIANNVAGANKKVDTSEDSANASNIVETVVSGMIDNGDYEGAKEYLDNNRKLLGPETLDAYMQVINTGTAADEKVKTEEEQAAKDQRIIEGKDYLPYGGNQFRLDKELASDANEIKNNDSFSQQLNIAGYEGPYDPKIPNGTTFYIKRDTSGSDKETFWDYIPFVHGFTMSLDHLSTYVTYYNGKWYESTPMIPPDLVEHSKSPNNILQLMSRAESEQSNN